MWRIVRWIIAGVVVVLLALAAQTAFSVFWVSRDAAELRTQVEATKQAVGAGHISEAAHGVDEITATAARLREHTSDSIWTRAEHLPLIGSTFAAVSVLSDQAAHVTEAAAPLSARLADADTVPQALAAISGSGDELHALQTAATNATGALDAVPTSGHLMGVDSALADAKDLLPQIADAAGQAADLAEVLPTITGSGAPTRWLVMLQNPAEARGSGGLFAAFAIIEVEDGKPTIVEAASRKSALDELSIPYDGLVGAGTKQVWSGELPQWASFNVSADFPEVAQLAAAGMEARGTPVDGVLAIDPTAVAALLAGTGPVEHKGVTIDASSAESFFTKDIYTKFPDFPDVAAKDDLSMGLLYATADSLIKRPLAFHELAEAMRTAIDDGHLKVWSADPKVETWLQAQPVGGQISTEAGPDAVIAINNGTGGKVDAYVTGTAAYAYAQCSVAGSSVAGSTVQSTVTLDLRNDAPEGLPPYVDLRLDDPSAPAGSTRLFVTLYGPKGATTPTITVDGVPYRATTVEQSGRPTWTLPVDLERGAEANVTWTMNEPAVPGATAALTVAPATGGIEVTTVDTDSVSAAVPCSAP